MITQHSSLPIAVLGAGPVGLAAAAHLLERGLTPLVLEAGASVGANLLSYAHVQLFSPWQYNVDKASARLLATIGWQAPQGDVLPTAGEIVTEYLSPLSDVPALAPHIKLSHVVTSIARQSVDKVKTAARAHSPFVIRANTPAGEVEFLARAVIDATGTWNQPNALGGNGLPALGERALADRVVYGMPDVLGSDRARYTGKRVLVVGSGHSAAGNLLALAQLADMEPTTQIVWATRSSNLAKVFGGGSADGLAARGALGSRLKALRESGRLEVHTAFFIHKLAARGSKIDVHALDGARIIESLDVIICSTGSRPNLSMTQELRLKLDPALETTEALAPLIDPNEHSCGTVRPHGHRELTHPEAGYYAVGAKSYGRAPTFLLVTGYEQARSVVAAIAGDLAAADDVQLVLPETGVCSTDLPTDEVAGCGSNCAPKPSATVSAAAKLIEKQSASCCGGPPKADADACCVKDEEAKAMGESGCGCTPQAPTPKSACCG